MADEWEVRMIDVIKSDQMELVIEDNFIWINVDGLCRFRGSVIRCKHLQIVDNRTKKDG